MIRLFLFLTVFAVLSAAGETPPPLVYTPAAADALPPIQETGICRTLPDKTIQWSPSPDPFRAAGGARIPAAWMAPDGALWIAETVGGPRGPFAVRLVQFAPESSEPSKVFRRDRCRASLLFAGANGSVGMLAETGEKEMQELEFSPETGECKVISDSLPLLSDRAQWGDLRIYAVQDRAEVLWHAPDKKQTIPAPFAGGKLLVLPELKMILLYRPEPSAIFRLDLDRLLFQPVLPLPQQLRPEFAIAADAKGGSAFFWSEGGDGFWWDGSGFYPLCSGCGNRAALNPVNGNLIVLKNRSRHLEVYVAGTPPIFRALVESARLKPLTRGDYQFLFPAADDSSAITILDSRGNLFTLEPGKRKRWAKILRYGSGI